MKERVLRTTVGAYRPAAWSGANDAGFDPIGDMVLVLPDEPVTKSAGGIIMPEAVTDQNAAAAESGVIVALGEGAFVWSADRHRPWTGRRPEVGDRVRMQRYSGQLQTGADGVLYRLMTDTCIAAIEQQAPVDLPAQITGATFAGQDMAPSPSVTSWLDR